MWKYLGFASALGILAFAPALTFGQIIPRSLRFDLPRPWDIRTERQPRVRTSHLGWEVTTDHFVVVATDSQATARELATLAEATWDETARIFDAWTDLHRRRRFANTPIPILLVDRQPARPSAANRFALTSDEDWAIVMNTGPDMEMQGDLTHTLRQDVARAFMGTAQFHALLPNWVEDGLAEYVAHEAENRLGDMSDGIDSPAHAWVHFFLEGDDARHAPRFARTMREALARNPYQNVDSLTLRELDAVRAVRPGDADPAFDTLRHAPNLQQRFRLWREDPQLGQPVVDDETLPSGISQEEAQEMAWILKVARRADLGPPRRVRPRVTDLTATAPSESVNEDQIEWQSLSDLWPQVESRSQGTWATLDPQGNPVISTDRQRLAKIFSNLSSQYAYTWQAKRLVLRKRGPTNTSIQAWLVQNPKNPHRPLLRVRRMSRVNADAS